MDDRIFNPADMVQSLARIGLREKPKAGDFTGEDGLLRCGICKQKKRHYIEAEDIRAPNKKRRIMVAVPCRCEEAQERKQAKEDKARKDRELVNELRSISLMGEKFQKATFKAFKVTKFNERNMKKCKKYAENFGEMLEKSQGLLMWGDVGTGKSYAAACIANYLLDRQISVVMTSFSEILKAIEANRENETKLTAKINRAKLVIFDDLGAERGTPFALEKVYNIIDSRVRRQRPMIFTTNLTIEQMKNERDTNYKRIYDRIFETCYPMQFTGPSWRRVEASNRHAAMSKFFDDE